MAVAAEFLTTRPALSIVPSHVNVTQQRIEVDRRERLGRLAAQAERNRVQLEPDTIQTGLHVAHRPDQRGRCELVSSDTCTCLQFRIWGFCEHNALLLKRLDGGKA